MERKIQYFDNVVRSSDAARSHAHLFPTPLTPDPFFAAGNREVSPQGVAKPGLQD